MESKNQEIQQPHTSMVPVSFNLLDPQQFSTMQRVCKMYTSSDLVPEIYRATSAENENKAIGNCMIALEVSMRIGASLLMVMQNMVPIYGKPSWSSKFLIATVNACGRFQPIMYKMTNKGKIGKIEYTEYDKVWETSSSGKKYQKNVARKATFDGTNIDNIECIAYTTKRGDDGVLEGSPVDLVMAILEGWYTKNGSKWQTMPLKMLKYRAASFWVNEFAPEISMGIRTIEEQEDMPETHDAEYEVVSTKMNDTTKKADIPVPQPKTEEKQKSAPQPSAQPKPQDKTQTESQQPSQGSSEPSASDDEPGY